MELTHELGLGRVCLHGIEPARAVAVVVCTLEGEQLLITSETSWMGVGSDRKQFPVDVGYTVFWCTLCETLAGARCQSHRLHLLLGRVVAVA